MIIFSSREDTEGFCLGKPREWRRYLGNLLCFLASLTCGCAGNIFLSWGQGYNEELGSDVRRGWSVGSTRQVGKKAAAGILL